MGIISRKSDVEEDLEKVLKEVTSSFTENEHLVPFFEHEKRVRWKEQDEHIAQALKDSAQAREEFERRQDVFELRAHGRRHVVKRLEKDRDAELKIGPENYPEFYRHLPPHLGTNIMDDIGSDKRDATAKEAGFARRARENHFPERNPLHPKEDKILATRFYYKRSDEQKALYDRRIETVEKLKRLMDEEANEEAKLRQLVNDLVDLRKIMIPANRMLENMKSLITDQENEAARQAEELRHREEIEQGIIAQQKAEEKEEAGRTEELHEREELKSLLYDPIDY
jgi:hypothetical protein